MTDKPLAIIVEDDPEQNEIFSQALSLANYQVKSCVDGQGASKYLGKMIPTLVVLDLNLPHVSGRVILAQIRKDPRLAQTRVILATANPREAEGLREQSDLVLIKPISFSQLKLLAERLHPAFLNAAE